MTLGDFSERHGFSGNSLRVITGGSVRHGRQGRVVEYTSRFGKKKKLKLHKRLPDGCRVAKRICIVCLTNPIHKLENNYDLKTCKRCLGEL